MRIIFYQHVLNEKLLEGALSFCSKKGILLSSLSDILEDEAPACCVFFDDAHISTKSMSHIKGFYYPVIGRCSCIPTPNTYANPSLPDLTINLQSAHYHSLKGNNAGFIPLEDLPSEKTINHCWWHTQVAVSTKISSVFEEQTARNWYPALWSNLKRCDRIPEGKPIHSLSITSAIQEVQPMVGKTAYPDIVVAPYNVCTDDFLQACNILGIKYCIHKRATYTETGEDLDVYRVNIDYDLNSLFSLI